MEDWRTRDVDELIDALLRLETADEAAHFLRDLCTLGELRDLAQRWAVVRRLDEGEHYAAISRETGASTATITRIATWLNHGEGGYREALAKLSRRSRGGCPLPCRTRAMTALEGRERLRLAIPNKGRLVEPTVQLLRDAGLVFEEHERSLVARVRNFDLDILFVRTNDVIEFVGDGVADLGVTGEDLLAETGAELPRLRSLGYGQCRLAAAVPADSDLSARSRSSPASASRRPTRTRRGGSSNGPGSPSTSSRSPAPSRSPRGSAWPRRSSISSRPARPS